MQGNNYIYEELKRRIVELEYAPGQLINEKQLIEEFNVSRTPIREALLKLAEKDLIEIMPRVGTIVSPVDIKSVKYAYEIKKYLEALAAELAAQRATEEDIACLLEIAHRMEKCDTVKQYKEYIKDDQLFHQKTREASRNPLLIEYLEELNIKTARFLQYIQYVEEDSRWHNESIKAIAYAIRDRDIVKAGIEAKNHSATFFERALTNIIN